MTKEGFIKNTSINFHQEFLICLLLVVALYAVYGQVGGYSFVRYDDSLYITENYRVQSGLNLGNIVWAFATTHASNWHPLTWLSHMLDVSLFGMNPGAHHMVNLFIHMANSILLFFVVRRMTGELWKSAFVAALFALHPLHVESVAWASERKDVLSALFWMLTMWSYILYTEKKDTGWYLAALLFFMLGLMAKPMLVTLPFVLLLLDYWPLRRFRIDGIFHATAQKANSSWVALIREKIPFIFLTAASCMVTYHAQNTGGSVGSWDVYPLMTRISNALIAYVSYIGKTIWPYHLAAYYPYPKSIPYWQVVGAGLVLMAVFYIVVLNIKRFPFLAVGWFWYVGTLVPVIGLVQVGGQAMADRYTYIPLIGIFIILVWGIPTLLTGRPNRFAVQTLLAAILLPILMTTTWLQVRHWADNTAFFEHWIKMTPDSYYAHYNLGVELALQHKTDEAARQYSEAIRLKPDYAPAHNNIGNLLVARDKFDEAIQHYSYALKLAPRDPEIHNNFGVALVQIGQIDLAIDNFKAAIDIKSDYTDARANLKKALKLK